MKRILWILALAPLLGLGSCAGTGAVGVATGPGYAYPAYGYGPYYPRYYYGARRPWVYVQPTLRISAGPRFDGRGGGFSTGPFISRGPVVRSGFSGQVRTFSGGSLGGGRRVGPR